ncbi:MAG: hydroxymethylglutaryl-CoA synthase family protein, partial [Clostridiales bacterium]|nr:hydroxymethylglutaryl-CoA synthase family protein [Clostridiales bacterium]
MIGITSYGAYIPYNRLQRAKIGEAYGKSAMKGEKAVANYDEDSITMAVSAALDCGGDPRTLDGIYYCSTCAPYKEKQCATVISSALDMRKNIRAADFAGSLRCASEAMLAAFDAAQAGRSTLVTAADCRLPFEDGQNEMLFGDGAAAVTVGSGKNVLAELIGTYS